MNKKCPNCSLVNYANAEFCARCNKPLGKSENITSNRISLKYRILKRAVICLLVAGAAIVGFYLTLIFSAEPLTRDQQKTVDDAIAVLRDKGFANEVFLLERLAVFRSNDNWLNASVVKENAFAATNFPLEIVTLYPDFFDYPVDDVERAAILLHEARHLRGEDEKEAYDFVWNNRRKLGWVSETYGDSMIWRAVQKQTREYMPNLFVCEANPLSDCTEPRRFQSLSNRF